MSTYFRRDLTPTLGQVLAACHDDEYTVSKSLEFLHILVDVYQKTSNCSYIDLAAAIAASTKSLRMLINSPSECHTSAPHRESLHTVCQQTSTRNQGSSHVGIPAIAALPPGSAVRHSPHATSKEIIMPNSFGGLP